MPRPSTARGVTEAQLREALPLGTQAQRLPGHAPGPMSNHKRLTRDQGAKGRSIPMPPPMPWRWPMGTWPTRSPETSPGAPAIRLMTCVSWR